MSPISSAMVAARISAIPGSVISRSISGVTSTKSSSRCSSCRICRTRKSICANNCLQTQRVCSGNGSIRASSSARALFPYASLYSLGGTPYLASVAVRRSEEHTSELQSRGHLVCRLLLEKKKKNILEKVERILSDNVHDIIRLSLLYLH